MIFRFSLYGFLKNQRYFEPFLVLVFLEKGLSYFHIGLLIAVRELCIHLLEVPSGALADTWGRRRSMIASFWAYIASFVGFGLAGGVPTLLAAMVLFAVGDAFRTGTHKAMIFTWLRQQDRLHERTRVYGYTRSWSQIGSAVSVVLGAAFVFASSSYTYVFYFAIAPYLLNIVNFLGYPKDLDGENAGAASLARVWRHTRDTLADAVRRGGLRRLMLESMGFEGVFDAVKGYLQPVLKAAALAAGARLALTAEWTAEQKSAVLIGAVYFALHLLSAAGSRLAHQLEARAGGTEPAARFLWLLAAALYAMISGAALGAAPAALIAAFVALHVVQNIWRPVIISRFDAHSDESQGATVLSLESQSQRVATILVAPLLGWVIDLAGADGGVSAFWPIGLVGGGVALVFLLTGRGGTASRAAGPGRSDVPAEGRPRAVDRPAN